MPRPLVVAAATAASFGLIVAVALRTAPAQVAEKAVIQVQPAPAVKTRVVEFGGMGGMNPGMQPGAGFTFREWAVKVEVVSGQAVSGILSVALVRVDCDLGDYYLDPDKVRAVRFRHKEGEQLINQGNLGTLVDATVTTTTGQEFQGKVYVQNWILETDLGRLALKADRLSSLAFSGHEEIPAEKGAKP